MLQMKKLEIKGFQAHKSTSIDLHPGLNIFVGASDSGKTAILRAIRWVVHNEPLGDGYINQAVGEANVKITTDKGSVSRVRGKENSYIVNEKVFQGFGTKVPEEVSSVVGMQKATFNELAVWLNYASQLDAPYLLSETSGQAARILGKLAGTEDLDAANKLVNSDLIKARNQKTALQEQYLVQKADYAKFENFASVESRMNDIREISKRIEVLKNTLDLHNEKLKAFNNVTLMIFVLREAISKIVIPEIATQKEQISTLARYTSFLTDITTNDKAQSINKKKTEAIKESLGYTTVGLKERIELITDLISQDGQLKLLSVKIRSAQKLREGIKSIPETDTLKTKLDSCERLLNLKAIIPDPLLMMRLCQKIRGEEFITRYEESKDGVLPRLELNIQLSDLDKQWKLSSQAAVQQKIFEDNAVRLLRTHKATYKDYLKTLGVCPVCQTEMSEEKINSYFEEV